MSKEEIHRRLASSVNKIKDYIVQCQSAPFLSQTVSTNDISYSYNALLTDTEKAHRQKRLEAFRNLAQFQKTPPRAYNAFLKNLYPANRGFSQLKASSFSRSEVIHSTLYKSYLNLPTPGAGHLKDRDLEEFMKQMFHSRVFVKPNVLSSSAFPIYNERYLLSQFADALQYRKEHLRKLWHIAKDMDEAKIPLTDYERRLMVFMTYYKDRPDILGLIDSFRAQLPNLSQEYALLKETKFPEFDWNTYRELATLDFDVVHTVEFKNTLLFCALRHANWLAEKDILSEFKKENYTRDTYKILLDNHAMFHRLSSFEGYLSALASDHLHLLDINLLNIIIRSLTFLNKGELAIDLASPFFECGAKDLRPQDTFLKLLTYSDKRKYSAYLNAHDKIQPEHQVRFYASEKTFLPLLSDFCSNGADFVDIMSLVYYIEMGWKLPLSSQVFKLLFNAFTTNSYGPENLEFVTTKLIEQHDRYYDTADSWVGERLNETSIPDKTRKYLYDILDTEVLKHHGTDEAVFLKISNGLVRAIFKAYRNTYKDDAEQIKRINEIETELEKQLMKANGQTPARTEDKLRPADLYSRDEATYLKKSSILELLDI